VWGAYSPRHAALSRASSRLARCSSSALLVASATSITFWRLHLKHIDPLAQRVGPAALGGGRSLGPVHSAGL
jgi:hypothetical protein